MSVCRAEGTNGGCIPASFGRKGESLTSVCRLARTPPAERTLHLFRRCLFLPAATRVTLCTSRSSSASPFSLLPHGMPLILPFPPYRRLLVPFFSRSFFREPSSLSASEESSRPSHVRGNPANFVEFPRNELKETGAAGRERWTRFGRIMTYEE